MAASAPNRVRYVFREVGSGKDRKLCVSESAFECKYECVITTPVRVRIKRPPGDEVPKPTTPQKRTTHTWNNDGSLRSAWDTAVDIDGFIQSGLVPEEKLNIESGDKLSQHLQYHADVLPFIMGTSSSIMGIYLAEKDEYITLQEAHEKELISPALYGELMERICAKAIKQLKIDPNFDKSVQLLEAQKSVYGFGVSSNHTMSMIELQKIPLAQGLKYLEAQICTGGVIDPRTGFRRPVRQAIENGLISRTIRDKIEGHSELLKMKVYDKDVTLSELIQPHLPENSDMVVKKVQPVHYLSPSGSPVDIECFYLVCKRALKSLEEIKFTTAWHKPCPLINLTVAKLVTPESADKFREGREKPDDTTTKIYKNEIRPWVMGNPMPIAGISLAKTGEVLNFVEAVERGIIKWGFARSLQEAQASNGFILDPKDGKTYTVDDAVEQNLVKENQADILRRAEKGATSGYTVREANGEERDVSFFDAISRNIVNPDHFMRMLEVQVACGGIIDPILNHRLPTDLAKEQGKLSDEIIKRLERYDDDTKGFYDINTGENLTYVELLKRCIIDEKTNLPMLVDHRGTTSDTAPIKMTLTIPEIEQILPFDQSITFEDIKSANIFNDEVLGRLEREEVTRGELENLYPIMESKMEGSPCIGGVLGRAGEELSLLQAGEEGILSSKMANDLIEAQAACGKLIDPSNGESIDVNVALTRKLISQSTKHSIERAYNLGYQCRDDDGSRMSIAQAMEGKRIAERTGLRYLDAQLATGGIIDHRFPFRMTYRTAVEKNLVGSTERFERKVRRALKTGTYTNPANPSESCSYKKLLNKTATNHGVLFYQLHEKTIREDPLAESIESGYDLGDTLAASRGSEFTASHMGSSVNGSVGHASQTEHTMEFGSMSGSIGGSDSRLKVSDLASSANSDKLITGTRHKSAEAPPPFSPTISIDSNPSAMSPNSNEDRAVKGRRIYIHDSHGNRITLREAVKQGIIDSETAKEIREGRGGT